jgi:hypothetical protein
LFGEWDGEFVLEEGGFLVRFGVDSSIEGIAAFSY